jgi:hypothetical protein
MVTSSSASPLDCLIAHIIPVNQSINPSVDRQLSITMWLLNYCSEDGWKTFKAREQLGQIKDIVDAQKKRKEARGELTEADESDECK